MAVDAFRRLAVRISTPTLQTGVQHWLRTFRLRPTRRAPNSSDGAPSAKYAAMRILSQNVVSASL
jgi:hypothetical protein